MTDDRRLLKVFPKPPMACFSRPKNIKDTTCRAKLYPARANMATRDKEDGFKRCGRNCKLCPFTGEATARRRVVKRVRVSSTGEDYNIRGNLTCSTKNILYLLTYSKADRTCPDKPQYGGETGQEAKKRFSEHFGTVTQRCHVDTTTPVGQHFRQPGHSVEDMVFTPVEKIYSSNVFVRKARERNLINKLDLIDNGLNKRL